MAGPKHDIEETPFGVREARDPEGALPTQSEQEQEAPSAPAGDPGDEDGPSVPAREPGEEEAPSFPAGEREAPVTPTESHPADGAGDHEAKLEHDLEELTAKAQRADQYLDLAQRTKADFENYRKRATREAAAAKERGVAKLALELLPAVDNLDRALAAAEAASNGDADSTLASGIKLVHADVIAALARVGIERYSPQGEQFDPQHHEAVAQQPVEGAQPGTIVEVYQQGYRLGDSVLRPARVVVAG
ncbi:MAG: nucleotide exchange factor GrpE [Solirubrobacterales bacterium]|nr:nucleotide exchange factor GrpE [Solirubrobacterales bacterium]